VQAISQVGLFLNFIRFLLWATTNGFPDRTLFNHLLLLSFHLTTEKELFPLETFIRFSNLPISGHLLFYRSQ
jgi:hypothetical protein